MKKVPVNKRVIEVTIGEMFDIIQKDLDDFDKFSHFIGVLLKSPEEFGLEIE
ncbi:hypothetical protein HKBW3S25_00514 [Candidatus Hakubella thermalkaliphila]|uniref:Uncharacterized protein n=1 Tax=Candidatus Hakubella thermalkaliphila TaxID=2754717 RepID=A0A6V8P066_9ACTN|nr:hypothetical protein HKBW3S25_00514 [Candidatus Hakubella thermalkaliphila]